MDRAHPFTEGRAVKIDCQLPNTSMARDAVELVKSGTVQGLSIEFRASSEGRRNGCRDIKKAHVVAAALVDSASHQTSVEVREEGDRATRRRWWN